MERKKKITLQQAYERWAETKRDRDFTTLYNLLFPKLNGVLVPYVYDQEIRDLILSNTMEKIWTFIHKYKPEYQFSTWACTIALNEMRVHWKVHNRMPTVSLDYTQELVSDETSYDFDDEKYDRAVDIIKDIEGHIGQALYLRDVKGMRYDDIATQMEVPLNSVKTWIRRGRERVKQTIS